MCLTLPCVNMSILPVYKNRYCTYFLQGTEKREFLTRPIVSIADINVSALY